MAKKYFTGVVSKSGARLFASNFLFLASERSRGTGGEGYAQCRDTKEETEMISLKDIDEMLKKFDSGSKRIACDFIDKSKTKNAFDLTKMDDDNFVLDFQGNDTVLGKNVGTARLGLDYGTIKIGFESVSPDREKVSLGIDVWIDGKGKGLSRMLAEPVRGLERVSQLKKIL